MPVSYTHLVTHDMELSEYADRIVVMMDGKIERIDEKQQSGGEDV